MKLPHRLKWLLCALSLSMPTVSAAQTQRIAELYAQHRELAEVFDDIEAAAEEAMSDLDDGRSEDEMGAIILIRRLNSTRNGLQSCAYFIGSNVTPGDQYPLALAWEIVESCVIEWNAYQTAVTELLRSDIDSEVLSREFFSLSAARMTVDLEQSWRTGEPLE